CFPSTHTYIGEEHLSKSPIQEISPMQYRCVGWLVCLLTVSVLFVNEARAQDAPVYRWSRVTDRAAYAPRDGAGALVFQNSMGPIGGWNPGDKTFFTRICNNEVWSSANGADWTLEKPNTFLDANFDPAADWEGRHTAGYVVFKDKLWIVGGDVNQKHYHFDVW